MRRVDKRMELVKKLQLELDRRTEIEKEAELLICIGKYKEATELLQALDDNIIKSIAQELDEFDSKDGLAELMDFVDELLKTPAGRDAVPALKEYVYAEIVKSVAEIYKDDATAQDLRNDYPEFDFMDDEGLEEILKLAKDERRGIVVAEQ